MSFVRRYPEQEIVFLAERLDAVISSQESIPEQIKAVMVRLIDGGKLIGALLEGGMEPLARADFERDELVRSLALHLKSWAHRRTLPETSKLAHRLYKRTFQDSYTWISSSYAEESQEIAELLKTLSVEEATNAAKIPGLTDIVADLRASEERFRELKQALSGDTGEDPLASRRDLTIGFHHDLDLYISLIDANFRAYKPSENAIRQQLLSPLHEATERVMAGS